jgi:ATP-dependent Lhr-like helicase
MLKALESPETMPFSSSDRASMQSLRTALPRAWPALFARFGRLLEIQVRGLPALLAGRNVVLASATASGKTETAVAPFAESAVARSGLQILYLAPTRALCNDLERRLSGPLRSMGLDLAIRTGERPELTLSAPEAMVITTPESLDSLLCRAPGVFARVRFVVLDELHLLDGTYRGDQLRILLCRLAALLPRPAQFAALSATLADPEGMARRYFDDPLVIRAPGARSLHFDVVSDLAAAIALLKSERRRKALLFCNRRRDVEEAAAAISPLWPRDRIAVHHASLSRAVRERAERAMREWPFGICIATTTLEIGLDIGDLDVVVLYGAPPTPSAFQQRIGRACRREEAVRAIGCAANADEAELFAAYADLARRGEVESRAYEPDLSVVVQQLFSALYAAPGGMPESDLGRLLEPLATPAELAEILRHLDAEGFLGRRAGRLVAQAPVMDLGEKGRLHSNIPDSREWRVVDERGSALGAILTAASPGDRFFLGGRAYMVEHAARGVLRVRSAAGKARTPVFRSRERGAFARYLPPELATKR